MTDNDEGIGCQAKFGGGIREVFGFLFYFIIGVWVLFGSLAGDDGWLAKGGGWILTPTKAGGGEDGMVGVVGDI